MWILPKKLLTNKFKTIMIKQHIGRFLLALSFFALLAVSVQAQRGQRAGFPELTDELKTELQLTDEQVTQLEALRTNTEAQAKALRETDFESPEDRRASMRQLHQETKAAVADILTTEQLARMRNMRDERRAERREAHQNTDHKALRAELREYRKTNIHPVMQAQRQKLEESLTDEDKASLEEMRITLREARQEAKAERQERRREMKKQAEGEDMRQERGRRRGHQGQHAQRGKQWKAGHEEEFPLLEGLAEKYDTEITELLAEIADQQEQWKADQKAIHEKYRPEERPERRQEQRADRREARQEKQAQRQKIKFLLMDPNGSLEEDGAVEATDSSIAKATAYPNPAVNQTTLTYTLATDSRIRIELRDESGNVLQTLQRGPATAGEHRLEVDLSSVQNGTYYLTLTGKGGTESVKVVVVQ